MPEEHTERNNISKNTIGNYKLGDEVSSEPFGSYYILSSSEGEREQKYLGLILTPFASEVILTKNPDLVNNQEYLNNDVDNIIWPINHIQVINKQLMIIMPYLDGTTVAEYIKNTKKPLKLSKTVKLLHPLAKKLSLLHKLAKYHGAMNFSNLWITNDNQIKLLGFNIFKILFNDLNLRNSDLDHQRINSCISKDMSAGNINCNISSDYYSMLVITCSLHQGFIPSTYHNDFNLTTNVSKDDKKLLSVEYNRKLYQNNQTLDYWFNKLKNNTKKTYIETTLIAVLLVSIIGIQFKNNQYDIKHSAAYKYAKAFYKKLYLVPGFYANKFDAAIGYVKNINLNISDFNQATHELNKEKQIITKINNLNCINNICNENIIDNIAGPNLINLEFNNAHNNDQNNTQYNKWVSKNYLTKKDYLTFCYLSSNSTNDNNLCSQKQKYKDDNILSCLINNQCSIKVGKLLNEPVTGLTPKETSQYIAWLNSNTMGNYQIMSDQDWLFKIAINYSPENSCQYNSTKQNSLNILADKNPVWVRNHDQTLLRVISTLDEQCVFTLVNINFEDYNGLAKKAVVRLTKEYTS